jgi:sialic acid synthase SpsE
MKVMIIAEPGSTSEGNLSNMEQCIVDAVEAGSDCIKFQWLSNAHELARRRRAPEYAAAYLKIEFPLQYFEVLKRNDCVMTLVLNLDRLYIFQKMLIM